ncbi:MAG: superoxide dismutase [Methylobacterium sp.]|nr:superoxide dismutase [Methylobacterium sp.]MCA3636676.1 superoxide dismutase [Methylobacterium sp.]MCA3639109.1 superoxide dismutase [Methylobacterium sp.]MCA3644335.1 superoxide dismutase [Methylobacterium sp.]MCA4923739.1 superoxide dismutase [Methylobacterium sp.]
MNVQLSRRLFLAGATVSAGASALPRKVFAQAAAPAAPTGPFALPQLGYAFNALEPHIDAMTMEIHSQRHHGSFIANLNNFAKDHGVLVNGSIPRLLAEWQQLPEAIRMGAKNSLGGHANHTMFWQVMTPGGAKAPEGELKAAIDRDLGGFDKLKADFNGTGGRLFGSGWVFVTVSKDGRLTIVSKPNQDTPLMDGQMVLFGNDVWEHAYYLKYQNRRPEYLANWWNVANWSRIGERYAAAKAGTLEM